MCCGELVCDTCSPDRQVLEGRGPEPVRVCDSCVNEGVGGKQGTGAGGSFAFGRSSIPTVSLSSSLSPPPTSAPSLLPSPAPIITDFNSDAQLRFEEDILLGLDPPTTSTSTSTFNCAADELANIEAEPLALINEDNNSEAESSLSSWFNPNLADLLWSL